MRRPVIGVMGGGDGASQRSIEWGYSLGASIADRGWTLLSGGRNVGVMNSCCQGAKDAGGFVVGVLPGKDTSDVSDAVDVAIVTGMGSARNNINVLSSDVVVACGALSAGTLSEIGLALKADRHIVLLTEDDLAIQFFGQMDNSLIHFAREPAEVIETIVELLGARLG